jgi:hypothetical protein
MEDIDLNRIDTSTMYCLVHLVSSHIHQLPFYRPLYKKIREEFARRGRSSDEIGELFDKFENGWEDRLYDPNAPPYKSPDQKSAEKLQAKIRWAREIGDKDLEDFLTFYQASKVHRDERDDQFYQLRNSLGEEVLRKKTIQALRDMADLLENNSGSWPGIYYCKLPENPLLKKTFIDGIEVIISYPWPG